MDNYEELEEINLEVVIHKQKECPICYDHLSNYITLECEHLYCLRCHGGLIRNNIYKCPLCRTEIKDIRKNIEIYRSFNNSDLEISNAILINRNKVLLRKYKRLSIIFLSLLVISCFFLSNYMTEPVEVNNDED